MSNESDRRRSTVHVLPHGWKKEEIVRKSGLSAGKVDVYYLSPDGRRARSKPQLSKLLGDKYDLSSFDFRSGVFTHGNGIKPSISVQSEVSVMGPIRQTASIFKQPVTVYHNHKDSKTRTDLKHGVQEPPKQLFWMKRLEGLQPKDFTDDDEDSISLQLPHSIQAASCGIVDTLGILQSIAAALHVAGQPIIGQSANNNLILKNPTVNINADQPLIQASSITDADLQRQELKVNEARSRLSNALQLLLQT